MTVSLEHRKAPPTAAPQRAHALAAAALAGLALSVHAQPDPQARPDSQADASRIADRGTFSFVLENDFLGERNKDRDYTNGFKMAWLQGRDRAPAWAKRLMSSGDAFFSDGSSPIDTRLEFEWGQQMYTPDDITLSPPDPTDRPYAGLLYGALGVVARRSDTSLEQAQLVLGVVGPASRAKETQRLVHRLIGAEDPRGWDTQIRDRTVVELRFQRTEGQRAANLGSYTAEMTPHYGFSLGNLVTSANLGLGARLGRRLPDDFGPPRISPSLPGSGYFVPSANSGWYAFGGVDLRYVAHSIVLDERSTLDAGVDRRPWVADVQLGVAAYWRDVSVAYTQVWRTKEYAQQREGFSSFGAISVVWRLD